VGIQNLKIVIRRVLLTVLFAVVFLAVAAYLTLNGIAHGPSPTVSNMLILAAAEASATKWVPKLFFDESYVDGVIKAGGEIEAVPVDDLKPYEPPAVLVVAEEAEVVDVPQDEWAEAIDGMIIENVISTTFKAYILKLEDPSRLYVAKGSKSYAAGGAGGRIYDITASEKAVAAINGGGFPDPGGKGSGGTPSGLTYSNGECIWDDGQKLTFIGFDGENRLIVQNVITRAEADELGIRDGVSFQTNKTLIQTVEGETLAFYADDALEPAQRTAIGQRADGTVIMMVTDGRTATSIGATRNDVIDVMLKFDVVVAGMLDGGSSTTMFYPGYHEKYGVDTSGLDKYQQMGLINEYTAFVAPRRLPTFFMVRAEQ
jgi:exopolysaccharide biosynthesis protein